VRALRVVKADHRLTDQRAMPAPSALEISGPYEPESACFSFLKFFKILQTSNFGTN